jgi:hypothetical protein
LGVAVSGHTQPRHRRVTSRVGIERRGGHAHVHVGAEIGHAARIVCVCIWVHERRPTNTRHRI